MRRVILTLLGLTMVFSSCQWVSESWWMSGDANEGEKIFRYDRLVDEFVSLNSFTSLQRMNTEYPASTRLLIEEVLAIGTVQEPRVEQRLREYFLDSTMQVVLEDVHHEYRDLRAEETEIFSVFRQLKEEDPAFRIPFVYSQISGLNQSILVGDSLLGISLDKYMGKDYSLYQRYYHDYQREVMERSRLVPDALFYYLSHEYPLPKGEVHTLLDYIARFGKLHWIIARLRNVSLEHEVGFDAHRVQWFREHEAAVWEWLNAQGALTSADMTMIRLFIFPRDTIPCIGEDCPDRIGLWLGMQIMEHYMKRHPETTIGELLRENDYEKILRESGYRQTAN